MFSRALSLFILTLPFLAIATAIARSQPDVCYGGSVHCCDSIQKATDNTDILQILSIAIPAQGVIGVACTPANVLADAKINCNQQTVCCHGDSFTGGYVTGCSTYNYN